MFEQDNIVKTSKTGQENNGETSQESLNRIKGLVEGSPVFLFMKGTPRFPQCGFSANTVAVLNRLGVSFEAFDVLSDPEVREGVKHYAKWPTFPQLYINGELIGGNDIVTEMYETGELQELLSSATK